jgi:long-chain acyl-CoA synthetase
VSRAASVLQSNGVAPGDRFAILSRNSFRNAELIHAGYWMGAVPVPVNYRLAPPEIAAIVADACCRIVVVEDVFADLLKTDALREWAGRILIVGASTIEADRPHYDPSLGESEPAPMHEPAEDDDALLVYTGGTTGRAKGVRLTHRNIVSNALQLGFELGPRADDVFLHVAPMFHSADLLATPYLMAGAAHVFLPKFSGAAFFEAVETWRVTTTLLTPTMAIGVLQEPGAEKRDLTSLRQILYGSSPMTASWIGRMAARFKEVELIQVYGLTETAPILTLLTMADHQTALAADNDELLRSVGRALVGVDMRVVDNDGRDVPVGSPGEVIVRGPNVTPGYWNHPKETQAAFRGGWFYTGDIGHLDEEGYLYLLDRKKDMIITGGENVFSLEVEAVLEKHPKVQECAVVGIPDEKYGEALLAAVVPMPGASLSDDEFIAHCRGKIGGYKIPRRYVYLDALPRSALNKVLKAELRERYAGKKVLPHAP